MMHNNTLFSPAFALKQIVREIQDIFYVSHDREALVHVPLHSASERDQQPIVMPS
jgi:hypothetical protein